MSNIDKYTQFITEQVRKGSVTGLRSQPIDEAASKGATRFGSSDSMHKVVHNDGKSHLTLHSSSDGQDNHIRGKMHDAKTGQTHKINIKLHGDEHEDDDLHGAIHDTVKEKAPNLPSHIHKKIASAVAKGWND